MPTLSTFGVIANDEKDDTPGIIKAINSGLKHLYFPSGEYLISSSLSLPNAIKFEGAPNAIFKAIKNMDVMLIMDKPYHATENFQIHNIIFNGNGKAKNCLHFYKLCYPTPAILRDVKCMNARETGVVLIACQAAKIDGLQSLRNGGNGVELIGCNGMNLFGLSTYQNKGNGLVVKALSEKNINYSGGLSAFGVHAEGNEKNGVFLENITTPISFFGGWVEGNKANGFLIRDSHVNLDALRISSILDESRKIYPIHIEKNKTTPGSNVIIDNCMVVNTKGSMRDVFDANNNKKKTIIRNLRKFNFINN